MINPSQREWCWDFKTGVIEVRGNNIGSLGKSLDKIKCSETKLTDMDGDRLIKILYIRNRVTSTPNQTCQSLQSNVVKRQTTVLHIPASSCVYKRQDRC